jgi:predicted lipoprotein with Yx(FWY)xxD motif
MMKVHLIGVLIVGGAVGAALGVASASGAPHSHSKSVVITAVKSAKFRAILSDGTTLYTLRPNATACTSTCHRFWRPVLLPKGSTKAIAGAGVNASKLGTVRVAAGRQVTYGGKALYWFFEDKSAGQVKGNVSDTWGTWDDVVLVRPASAPATTTTTAKVTPTSAPTMPTTTTSPPRTTTPPATTTTAPGSAGGVGF